MRGQPGYGESRAAISGVIDRTRPAGVATRARCPDDADAICSKRCEDAGARLRQVSEWLRRLDRVSCEAATRQQAPRSKRVVHAAHSLGVSVRVREKHCAQQPRRPVQVAPILKEACVSTARRPSGHVRARLRALQRQVCGAGSEGAVDPHRLVAARNRVP